MSMMVSFVLSFFPRDVLDEILNLIESVFEDFPSYSSIANTSITTHYYPTVKHIFGSYLSLSVKAEYKGKI